MNSLANLEGQGGGGKRKSILLTGRMVTTSTGTYKANMDFFPDNLPQGVSISDLELWVNCFPRLEYFSGQGGVGLWGMFSIQSDCLRMSKNNWNPYNGDPKWYYVY